MNDPIVFENVYMTRRDLASNLTKTKGAALRQGFKERVCRLFGERESKMLTAVHSDVLIDDGGGR